LAAAAEVTESYISQLLTRKKLPPAPLFKEVRELILRKCAPTKRNKYVRFFEKQPFGELERPRHTEAFGVVKRVAKQELESEHWLHLVGRF